MRGVACASLFSFLALSLAGCSDGGSGDGPPAGDDGEDADGRSVPELPSWQVRDWWTFDSPFGPSTYVLTADGGQDWFFDTDNPETAFFDAKTDISRLGPVRKSDLAGSQGSDRVEFFRWPPTSNATWSTTWDGQSLTIVTEDVTADTAVYSASNATGVVYRYAYDAAVAWFSYIESYGPDGSLTFTFEHSDHGHKYTGDVVRWTLETLIDFTGSGPVQAGQDQFEVQEGVTDLWLEMHLVCPTNAGFVFAAAPVGPTAPTEYYEVNQQCDGAFDLEEAIAEAPTPGTWAHVRDVGGGPEEPQGTILLLARTLETIPVA